MSVAIKKEENTESALYLLEERLGRGEKLSGADLLGAVKSDISKGVSLALVVFNKYITSKQCVTLNDINEILLTLRDALSRQTEFEIKSFLSYAHGAAACVQEMEHRKSRPLSLVNS